MRSSRERAAGVGSEGGIAVKVGNRAEALAPDQPHGVVGASLRVETEAVDRDDSRVLQATGNLGLDQESAPQVRVIRDLGVDGLEGDFAFQAHHPWRCEFHRARPDRESVPGGIGARVLANRGLHRAAAQGGARIPPGLNGWRRGRASSLIRGRFAARRACFTREDASDDRLVIGKAGEICVDGTREPASRRSSISRARSSWRSVSPQAGGTAARASGARGRRSDREIASKASQTAIIRLAGPSAEAVALGFAQAR